MIRHTSMPPGLILLVWMALTRSEAMQMRRLFTATRLQMAEALVVPYSRAQYTSETALPTHSGTSVWMGNPLRACALFFKADRLAKTQKNTGNSLDERSRSHDRSGRN